MDRITERQQERDATASNRKLAIRVRAIEILRNTAGVMTMLEAIDRAAREFDAEVR